ncbi:MULTISPECIES: GGDEF domain-containing protein [unclassified Pseudoalteromonas]|uniref:GGDEF domain-containing protein n=1 Tax=unclassified Pseudoalteromonas TaxID=194690 RepID=UPI0005A88DFE|nr:MULTISPECIES: GGDEF domain-containing protein [unclassified Pseudoalteromonas]
MQVKHQQHALEQVAMTDHLTGLYNRHFLMPFLEKALVLAKRQSHDVSLVMIDLDNFKPINDQLGHDAGDELLIAVANILQAETRVEN